MASVGERYIVVMPWRWDMIHEESAEGKVERLRDGIFGACQNTSVDSFVCDKMSGITDPAILWNFSRNLVAYGISAKWVTDLYSPHHTYEHLIK